MPRHSSIRVPPIGIPALEPVLPLSTPLTPLESALTAQFRVLAEISRNELLVTPLESALPEVASATPLESALTKNVPGHTPFPMASSQFHPDDSIFPIINCLRQPCCPACGFTRSFSGLGAPPALSEFHSSFFRFPPHPVSSILKLANFSICEALRVQRLA